MHLPLLAELNADTEVMRFLLGRPASPEETAAEWEQRLERQSDVLGMTHVDTVHRGWEDPLPGAELGEVVYEVRRDAVGGPGPESFD